MNLRKICGTIFALSILPALSAASAETGDAGRGAQVYQRCMSCHSPDANKVGPVHRGVVGRRAGSVAGFQYSDALRNAGFVWDEDHLDKWLTDPQALVPGARMFFKLSDAQQRADVIAYLKTLK